MMHYILDKDTKRPIPVHSLQEWSKWFRENSGNRHVARSYVLGHTVSTVFLAINHEFTGTKKPVLWETAIDYEDGVFDVYDRYSSYEDALQGHQEIVDNLLRELLLLDV